MTRGPSLDPHEKRLAVHVEDHPIDYAPFEGTIPKGQYGGGTVIVWDKGSWKPEGDPAKAMKKGRISFELDGHKLHGLWHLVRLKPRRGEKRDNWLLIKSDDAAARPGEDILEDEPKSVKSGLTIEEVAEGKTTDEVAVILGVSSNTVNSYLTHAIQKFAASNRAMAIATAIRSGII